MPDYPIIKVKQSDVEWATDHSLEWIRSTTAKALGYATDYRKKERREASLCKRCYYGDRVNGGRIGGAALTTQPCGVCGKEQMYGSTATDKLCRDCAVTYQLCKQCNADQELRPRRKVNFP